MQTLNQMSATETLDNLDRELELILQYLESDTPEEREIAEEVFQDFLPRLEKKIDSYVNAIGRIKARRDFRQAEANRIAALAKSDDQTITWLTQKLQNFMENRAAELSEKQGNKLEGLYCRISLCNNGGKPPIWVNPDLDLSDFPSDYIVPIPTLNTDKLKEDVLMQGEIKDSQGRLIAKVLSRGRHIRIS